MVSRSHPPAARADPRDVAELRRLRVRHPELASAVDLQLALIDLQRRIESRVPLPTSLVEADLAAAVAGGRPVLRFRDLPLDWSDFRFALRETADILARFDIMERADGVELLAIMRDGHRLKPVVERWFAAGVEAATARRSPGSLRPALDDESARFDQVLTIAIRPFLSRCAEALLPRLDLSEWRRSYCPLCAGEPELGVITSRGDHHLICSRCRGRWPFDTDRCAFCNGEDRSRLTSFVSPDGLYRLTACRGCLRYLKVYDERAADRPVLVVVDTIATLPLDAAAVQRGFVS